jgi:hypothetical protein
MDQLSFFVGYNKKLSKNEAIPEFFTFYRLMYALNKFTIFAEYHVINLKYFIQAPFKNKVCLNCCFIIHYCITPLVILLMGQVKLIRSISIHARTRTHTSFECFALGFCKSM